MDTNTLSHLVRAHRKVSPRVVGVPMAALCMSSVTESELLYGLATRPESAAMPLSSRCRT
jgi:tRNA(fMet)-specific endonuclease VapC